MEIGNQPKNATVVVPGTKSTVELIADITVKLRDEYTNYKEKELARREIRDAIETADNTVQLSQILFLLLYNCPKEKALIEESGKKLEKMEEGNIEKVLKHETELNTELLRLKR